MTDDEIIEKMAIALCHEYADGTPCDNAPCAYCMKDSRAALAVARPIIRAMALEEAAKEVELAGWHQSTPDCDWTLVDNQITFSSAAIRALKEQP